MFEVIAQHAAMAAGLAGVFAALAVMLALQAWRLRGQRDAFRTLNAANFEGHIQTLKAVVARRKEICEGVSEKLEQVPQFQRTQAEMVSFRLVQGLRTLHDSLMRQVKAGEDSPLDLRAVETELIASDEAMARLANLLVEAISRDQFERLKTEFTDFRESAETEKKALTLHLETATREKTRLEDRVNVMAEPEELSKTRNLLSAMQQDIDELERGLLGADGQPITEVNDDQVEELEKEINRINEELGEAEGGVHGAIDGLARHGNGQRVRISRIRRSLLQRLVGQGRAEKRANVLEKSEAANREILAEVSLAEESNTRMREAMGASARHLQALTQRIQQLENMEETSQRVKQELRNLGIINLDLQRSVEDMQRSQALYERALRSLSKLKGEIEERDDKIRKMETTIKGNDREIKRLQALLAQRQDEGRISIEAKPVGASGTALASDDISTVKHALREKLEENNSLRGKLNEMETELEQKQTQIGALEGELDQLFNEYQKLIDKVPLA